MRVATVLLGTVTKYFHDFAQSAETKPGYSNVETYNGRLLRNYYVHFIVTADIVQLPYVGQSYYST